MSFRLAVRAFNQYRTHCSPSVFSRSWFSRSSLDENGKNSITVAGKTIKYVRKGEGEHAVLCLPGALGSSWTDFKPQIEGLDPNIFTVIAWDPPGYGHSRPPDRHFGPGFLNQDADYAVDLMKALDLPNFSVLGWSDGGITGIILAAKYPQNLRHMAIWGANAYITDEEATIYKKIRDVSTWSERMRAPMVELYGEDGFRTMWEQWVDEFLRIHREDNGDICKKEVKSIKCPLFVLHGKKDPMVLPEHPEYIIENVPGSQLYTFEDGKHNIHLRYAKEFNTLVQKFLTSDQRSGTTEHRLPVRLPSFWSDNPAVWFAQIEAQFQLSDIRDDLTKFNCVLAQLETRYAARIEDVICDPPGDGKYNLLKTELISRLRGDLVKQSLDNAEIGNKTPSEFLSHLRELAGNKASESLLRSFWLAGLPSHVQSIVSTQSAPLDSLAELADRVAIIQPAAHSIDLSSLEQRLDTISKQLAALTGSIPKIPSQRSSVSKRRSAAPKPRTSSHDTQAFTIATAPKFDVTGLPLPGYSSPKDILKDILPTSKYHSLLTDFPGILCPSKVPQAVHRQTRHRIQTKSNVTESVVPFRLNESETRIARDIIDSMIRRGTARPSNSSYGSALRVIEVLRTPGWHAFGDYRALNSDTVSDSCSIRHPIEISHVLWGCNVFSVVNLRKDWTQIPVAPEDIAKTAVTTPFGKFEFPFMPRGLLNSSKTWQKVLDEVLQGLTYCFGYLDGILVYSRNHKEHLEHIRTLFQRLSVNGIFVNPSTSVFGEPSVDFFNYSISGSGCSPIPEKTVQAIENIRVPKTYADVGRFLRMNNAYRRYIPASLESPLKALVEESEVDWGAPVPWTSELEQAFKDCKSALSRATLYSQPDPFAPLSISVSVGNHAIGAVLNQKTLGNTVPIAFFSKLIPPQRSGSYGLYLMAIYEAVKEFRPWVGARDFSVLMDLSFGVKILEEHRFSVPARFYYASYCSQYTMDIQYVRPVDNAPARCLAALVESHSESSESSDLQNNSTDTSVDANTTTTAQSSGFI